MLNLRLNTPRQSVVAKSGRVSRVDRHDVVLFNWLLIWLLSRSLPHPLSQPFLCPAIFRDRPGWAIPSSVSTLRGSLTFPRAASCRREAAGLDQPSRLVRFACEKLPGSLKQRVIRSSCLPGWEAGNLRPPWVAGGREAAWRCSR